MENSEIRLNVEFQVQAQHSTRRNRRSGNVSLTHKLKIAPTQRKPAESNSIQPAKHTPTQAQQEQNFSPDMSKKHIEFSSTPYMNP